MTLNQKTLDAISEAMGYEPEHWWIQKVVKEFTGWDVEDMEAELSELAEEFEEAGGRGVDLANRIDALRTAIAYRQANDE